MTSRYKGDMVSWYAHNIWSYCHLVSDQWSRKQFHDKDHSFKVKYIKISHSAQILYNIDLTWKYEPIAMYDCQTIAHIYNHFIAKTFYIKLWQITVKTKIKDLP